MYVTVGVCQKNEDKIRQRLIIGVCFLYVINFDEEKTKVLCPFVQRKQIQGDTNRRKKLTIKIVMTNDN